MRIRCFPILFAALLGCIALRAQDPALKDAFLQAKAAWATQGDRETSSAKFGSILAALEPVAPTLDAAWVQLLCETYNWMAILDDRLPARRERAPKYLEAALNLNHDFEIDRNITNTRLQGAFELVRASRFGRVQLALAPEGGSLILDGKPAPLVSPNLDDRLLKLVGAAFLSAARRERRPSAARVAPVFLEQLRALLARLGRAGRLKAGFLRLERDRP